MKLNKTEIQISEPEINENDGRNMSLWRHEHLADAATRHRWFE